MMPVQSSEGITTGKTSREASFRAIDLLTGRQTGGYSSVHFCEQPNKNCE